MKYIVVKNMDSDKEEIITFPSSVNHDVMAQSVARMKDKAHGNWKRMTRDVVSAGFVGSSLECYGRSETLNLDSRPADEMILREQMSEWHPRD